MKYSALPSPVALPGQTEYGVFVCVSVCMPTCVLVYIRMYVCVS